LIRQLEDYDLQRKEREQENFLKFENERGKARTLRVSIYVPTDRWLREETDKSPQPPFPQRQQDIRIGAGRKKRKIRSP
jgi:hypothetical protein